MKPILSTMLSIGGTQLSDNEKRLLEKANPMGITLFVRNIENKEQVRSLTDSIREVIGREDVLIAVDQEGGRVCRFMPPEFRKYVSQYALGSLKNKADREEMVCLHGLLIADELKQVGVNLNYAPCVDVRYETTASVLKSRCFSENERIVASCGAVLLDTYCQCGIVPCLKHVPGHGRAHVDPHLNLPVLPQSLKELEKDFYPFYALAEKTPMMMSAHICLPQIAPEPVTHSAVAIQEIVRSIIGFDGFLISDAIDMRALSGSLAEKTRRALDAGCDGVCYCLGKTDELNEVIDAARPLTDKGLERFAVLQKTLSVIPPKININSVYKKYQELATNTHSLSDDYDAVEVLNVLNQKK